LPVIFTHFKIGCQLNSISRTGFFAESAKNTPRKIDPEKLRVSSACFILCSLKRYTIDRTGSGTQVAGYTSFILFLIPRQDNPSPVTRWQIRLYFRVFHRLRFVKNVKESQPYTAENTEHTRDYI
jgi:hypothetical protein